LQDLLVEAIDQGAKFTPASKIRSRLRASKFG